jgi:hypothetical protein
MLGVESGQGFTQFMHWWQWAFGKEVDVFPPYSFSTGCTGHNPEHHALFHSKNKLNTMPVRAMEIINKPVAIPLELKMACLKGTIINSNRTDITFRIPDSVGLSILFPEIP